MMLWILSLSAVKEYSDVWYLSVENIMALYNSFRFVWLTNMSNFENKMKKCFFIALNVMLGATV